MRSSSLSIDGSDLAEMRATAELRKALHLMLSFVAVCTCTVSAHSAYPFRYGFLSVDNSAGGRVMDGYVSQALWADTYTDFLSAQLLLELEAGSVFQDEMGGSEFTLGRPPALLVEVQPSLAFDTHVSVAGDTPQIVAGGAINLGGMPRLTFDSSRLDIAWSSGHDRNNVGRIDLGMLTLSEDASGRGGILLSRGGVDRENHLYVETVIHWLDILDGSIGLSNAPDAVTIKFDRSRKPARGPYLELPGTLGTAPPQQSPSPSAPRNDQNELHPTDGMPIADLVPLLSEAANLAGLELDQTAFSASAGGNLILPLDGLSEDGVSNLVASGNWSLRDENLFFVGGRGVIPEPSSIVLAALAVGAAWLCWHRGT